MKALGLLVGLLVAAVLVATAFAQPEDPEGIVHDYQAVAPPTFEATTARDPVTRVSASTKLAPLVLPNIAALSKQMWKVDRKTLTRQLTLSNNVIRFWHGRGQWIRAPRVAKCWDVPWQRSCTVARASLRLHTALHSIAETRLTRELPLTNDWLTAVRLVQRIYPGTADWMLYISHREGGYGQWVWWAGSCSNSPCLWHGYHIGSDSTGDTVGGWAQFRYSTFAPYWRATEENLRQRGYIVPHIPMPPAGGDPKYAAWLSPLGQALTMAYMKYYGKEGCHWCLG